MAVRVRRGDTLYGNHATEGHCHILFKCQLCKFHMLAIILSPFNRVLKLCIVFLFAHKKWKCRVDNTYYALKSITCTLPLPLFEWFSQAQWGYGRNLKCSILVNKTWRSETKHTCEGMKWFLQKQGVDWIQMAQDRIQLLPRVNIWIS